MSILDDALNVQPSKPSITVEAAQRRADRMLAGMIAAAETERVALAEERRPIDIEALVQWAMAREIMPRLRVPSARELSLNPYTVLPKGFVNELNTGGVDVEGGRPADDIDAERVLRAIDRLDPFTGSMVRNNGRGRCRPDWFDGVEPKQVTKWKRSKKGHRKVPTREWKPVHPKAIRAARDLYLTWHGGLRHLVTLLDGELLRFRINGLSAPMMPWEGPLEKTA